MAVAFLSHVVADLTLGKPALFGLPISASVRDALWALKLLADDVTEISIWECACGSGVEDTQGHSFHGGAGALETIPFQGRCHCVGKVCMQKIICYLASYQSLCNPGGALSAPVAALFADDYPDMTVEHVDPQVSLVEALQLLAAGVQNLIVPITRRDGKYGQQSKGCHSQKFRATKEYSTLLQASHGGQAYCWLTHEDVMRFLVGSIGVFSPLPTMSIEDLGIIKSNIFMVKVEEDAASALELIKDACLDMSAVAVVDDAEDMPGALTLVGDISCTTLRVCNETVALALATLSAGDFLMYVQECQHPSEEALDLIRARLCKKLVGSKNGPSVNVFLPKVAEVSALVKGFEAEEESSSDGESSGADSPTGPHDISRKWLPMHRRTSSRIGFSLKSRTEPTFCSPKSSLMAVLLQALAYREHYVWVTGEYSTLLGIVTLSDILTTMLQHLNI